MLRYGRVFSAIVAVFIVCNAFAWSAWAVGPELLDTSFQNPKLNSSTVPVVVQPDGKILVGGGFTTAGANNTPYGRIARFNPDGSLDTSFANPQLDGLVMAIGLQSDGKIVLGGLFTAANSVSPSTYRRAVRLNSDGTVDTSFADPNFDNYVSDLAVLDDGKIIFVGAFANAGGNTYGRVARVNSNGTVDTGFTNPAVGDVVSHVRIASDGKILITGGFNTVGSPPQTYNRLARINAGGTVDTTFVNPALNNNTTALTIQRDGKILVGGTFTSLVGPTTRTRLARLNSDGSPDTGFVDPMLSAQPYTMVEQTDGKLMVGGAFTTVGLTNTPYNYLVRLTSTGLIDTSFANPNLNLYVQTIAFQPNGNFVVAGSFTTAGSSNAAYGALARFLSGFYTLSITPPTHGTVTGNAGGIDCGATCSAELANGRSVVLTATAASGYSFAGWGGGCSGNTNPLTVTLSADVTCTASFTASGGGNGGGGGAMPPPAPPPSFVSAPVTPIQNASSVGSGTGSVSFASSFTDPQSLTFTATQTSGASLPSWLSFVPSTVSFAYSVPIPPDLPIQPLADAAADGRSGRADARASWANTIYPSLIRVAQVPVLLTATGGGQSYASTIQMDFYAPRAPVAMSAVSLSLDGTVGNGRSGRSALSWDGGQMVFETVATNIFPASANSQSDIVRYQALSGGRDRLSQTAIPGGGVANAADGASVSPAVSSDGRYGAFASDAPSVSTTPNGGVRQVYRTGLGYPRVPLNGTVTPAPDMVSVTASGVAGNAASDNPVLSRDGRYVAFESVATNLGGSGVAGQRQVWRKDMQTGTLEAVSSGTGQNPSISWDGRYVAFDDGAQVYLRDMTAATVRTVAPGTRPRLTARADRIALVSGGQVMLADIAGGGLRAVTTGNGVSDDPAISADGRFVAFRSAATDLVPGFAGNGMAQIFVRDVDRGVTALVTQTGSGGPGSGASWSPTLSGDGSMIAFGSDARDLVNGNPAAGQAYLAANPLPLPEKTGYWYLAGIGGAQGWAMERWGNRAYVGGLAYDAQGRSQWLAGYCTLSGLTCSGTLSAAGAAGPGFSLVTAATGSSATLSVGGAVAQTLTPFPIGGSRTTGYAGLPQAGWWYEAAAGNNVGYFLDIDSQPQADGSVAQIGYLSMLAYDAAGRHVWQSVQAPLGSDFSLSGTLLQYAGGAPFGVTAAAMPASASIVGPVRISFDGTEAARITLPDGRTASLSRYRF